MSHHPFRPVLIVLLILFIAACNDPVIYIAELDVLVNTRQEPPGINCTAGGTEVSIGLDDDGDGTLEPGEIENVFFVCNGAAGEPGPPGATGPTGSTGPQGPAGPSGPGTEYDLLIESYEESPGPNCEFGGVLIATGLDVNSNGQLESNEVMESFFVCNGSPGPTGPTGPAGPTGPTG